MNCDNCNTSFDGNYCTNCGQKVLGRVTLKEVFNETFGSLINYDSGLLNTVIGIVIKPKQLINNYFRGKRIAYYNPFKLLIAIIVIKSFILKVTVTYGVFGNFVNNEFYVFFQIILYLFIFSFFSYIIFNKKGYNYAEHFVLNAYYHSTVGLIYIIFHLPFLLFNWETSTTFNLTSMFFEILFFIYFYFKLFNGNSFLKILKSFLVFILSISFSLFIIKVFY